MFNLPLDAAILANLKYESATKASEHQPAFWQVTVNIAKPGDTFLDMRSWGKGVVWVNDHCLGRYWNIGPTQTMFVPGPWLKRGDNQLVILDLLGPEQPTIAGLAKPVLNQLRLNRDITPRHWTMRPALTGIEPVKTGEFTAGGEPQEVKFDQPARGKYVCLESISAFNGAPDAAVAELDLLDEAGQAINHDGWTVAYVDSESGAEEDGSAENAFDGQAASYWHTAAAGGAGNSSAVGQPHQLILDLGQSKSVGGFRYVPRQGGADTTGRIKEYRFYIGDRLVRR